MFKFADNVPLDLEGKIIKETSLQEIRSRIDETFK